MASDITVTRMDDPAPNGCLPIDCSLREAVIAANASPTIDDVIHLSSGTYTVNNMPLAVTGGTQFQGAGKTLTLIRGNGNADVITFSGEQQLSLGDLSIDAHGKRELVAVNDNRILLERLGAPNPMGGIEVRAPDNNAPYRGSFEVTGSDINAAIKSVDMSGCMVSDSHISRLSVSGTIDFGINYTYVFLKSVVVDGALAPTEASGLSISTGNLVDLDEVTVIDTHKGLSIGASFIQAPAELKVDRLHYVGNSAPMLLENIGGSIARSEFLDNTNEDIEEPKPGALEVGFDTEVEITGSTFTSNRGSSTAGGAILVEGPRASLSMLNSTFSGNSVSLVAAAVPGGARGGSIGFRQDSAHDISIILKHITVVAPLFPPAGLTGSAIGGFGAPADGNLRIFNSILRGSCSFTAGSIDLGIGNIESGGNTCGLSTDFNAVGVSSTALALGTLANHGGRTETYLPAANSVAIDSGFANFSDSKDQRGYPRPLGAACDVGAVEAGDVIFADGFE